VPNLTPKQPFTFFSKTEAGGVWVLYGSLVNGLTLSSLPGRSSRRTRSTSRAHPSQVTPWACLFIETPNYGRTSRKKHPPLDVGTDT
jgi:hypothetical protein